jgi:hypothetical protein
LVHDTLLPPLVKLLETFLENIFLYISVSNLVVFAVTTLTLENRPSRTVFSHGNKNKSDGDRSEEHGGYSRVVTLCFDMILLDH